jgi:DNA-binding response OmpR family regulator
MSKIKFLVVDDATFIRDMLKRSLRDHFPGCEIIDTSSAKKAQVLLKTHRVDIVLCDWEMPEMTGEEFLRWIRSKEEYQALPFIMVTSRGERDYIIKAAQAGVNDYIGKPFTPEALVTKVTKVLKSVGKDVNPRLPESAHGFGGASLDVLTGGKAKESIKNPVLESQKPNAAPASSVNTSTSKLKSSAKTKNVIRGQALLTFAGFDSQCVISGITLQLMNCAIKREQQLPTILETVVISIVQNDGEDVARLNGYVQSIQAAENRIDAGVLKLVIRFVDDDPDKLEHLSKYIAKF